MDCSSSTIGVSSLCQSNPSLDHYSRQYISILPLSPHFTAFYSPSSAVVAAYFRCLKSSASKSDSNSFVPLAVLTPNSSVLSEEAFKGLGGFGKNILDASEGEYEDSKSEVGESEARADKDELDIARLGLPQWLVESLKKCGITQLFPIQAMTRHKERTLENLYNVTPSSPQPEVSLFDTEMKTLKYLVPMIHKYKNSTDDQIKDHYCKLLGELLGIFSHMKHLYSSDDMEGVILELQKLFISRPEITDGQLFWCKPNLAHFMGGLGHMDLVDSDNSAWSLAAWELYHVLLRERHWAFVHLAISAFGYFAAHTSCNQLWRFVPQDADLSFDVESGNEADEERFMSELKAFLEKEIVKPRSHQLEMLVKEG